MYPQHNDTVTEPGFDAFPVLDDEFDQGLADDIVPLDMDDTATEEFSEF